MSELHIDSIQKSFNNIPLLTDIFIKCNTGEIIGILGRNGSGKTTLMQIIFGSIPAENRYINVDGKMILNQFDHINQIHYLPQFDFIPHHLRIKNIIKLYCNKMNTAKMFENPIIKPLIEKKINQISGGERRLISVYLLLYSDAKFILLDEPFNGIAPIQRENIQEIIQEQSQFKGFIITDHDYRSILKITTKTILLHDGGTKIIHSNEELVEWGYLNEL